MTPLHLSLQHQAKRGRVNENLTALDRAGLQQIYDPQQALTHAKTRIQEAGTSLTAPASIVFLMNMNAEGYRAYLRSTAVV